MSKHITFFFLILPAVTRFAASNMVVTTNNDCKGRQLTMTYVKNFMA